MFQSHKYKGVTLWQVINCLKSVILYFLLLILRGTAKTTNESPSKSEQRRACGYTRTHPNLGFLRMVIIANAILVVDAV